MLPSSLPLSHTWREFLEDVQLEASFQATDRGDSDSETRDLPHFDAPGFGTSHASQYEHAERGQTIPHAWTTGEENALVAHDAHEQPHHEHPRQSISHFAAVEDLPESSYSELHGDREGGQASQDASLDVTNCNDRTHDHFFDGAPFNAAVDYNPSTLEINELTPCMYDASTLASGNEPDHELQMHGEPQSMYENNSLLSLPSEGLSSRRNAPVTKEGYPLSIVPFQAITNLDLSNVSPIRQAIATTHGHHIQRNWNIVFHDYSHLAPSLEQLDLVWSLPPFEEQSGIAPWYKAGLTKTKNGQSVKARTATHTIKCSSCSTWHKDQAHLKRHAKVHTKDPHATCILCGLWVQNRPDKFNDHRKDGSCSVYVMLAEQNAVVLWVTVYGLVNPRPKQFGRGKHFE